jgi:hypothetical protein
MYWLLINWYRWRHALPALLLLLVLLCSAAGSVQASQDGDENEGPGYVIAGRLIDSQGQPVPEAHISAHLPDQEEPLAETESQEDGNWGLILVEEPLIGLHFNIERPHFERAWANWNCNAKSRPAFGRRRSFSPAFWP